MMYKVDLSYQERLTIILAVQDFEQKWRNVITQEDAGDYAHQELKTYQSILRKLDEVIK